MICISLRPGIYAAIYRTRGSEIQKQQMKSRSEKEVCNACLQRIQSQISFCTKRGLRKERNGLFHAAAGQFHRNTGDEGRRKCH